MTDLEITKLCAEAMGFEISHPSCDHLLARDDPQLKFYSYDPLHDDAQAMALVKMFYLDVCGVCPPEWYVVGRIGGNYNKDWKITSNSLNRAICECVAKMQLEKEKQK